MLHAVEHINGGVMWANLHLLFWLSLTPFVTAWLGESGVLAAPVAIYGVVLLMSGVAYYILAQCLIRVNGPDSAVAKAIGRDTKGLISVVIYLIAIVFAALSRPIFSCALYVLVSIMWLIPDRRIVKVMVPSDK